MVTPRSGSSRSIPSFAQLVTAGTVPMSRRDLMRASALAAAAAGAAGAGIQTINAAPLRSDRSRTASQDVTTDVELHLPLNTFGQPLTLDPHQAPNWGPFWVFMPYVWSGLLRFDENGAVEPDLAESVEPNEDGSVWTATIKEGAAFADGSPVLAEHFLSSWRRALDPTRLSPMSRFMMPVQGVEEHIQGDAPELGFRALDKRTIEITLSEPLNSFPSSLATFVWAVINPSAIGAEDGPALNLKVASAGPWFVTETDDSTRVVMVPNEHYWAAPSPSVTSVVWEVAPGGGTDQAILDQYATGQLAIADVPASLFASVDADPALAADLNTIDDHASTLAIGMDFHQPPFNDVRVRRAIAQAIDKEAWASDITGGEFVPADSFTPPVLSTIAGYEAPTGLSFDADAAASLLSDAGLNLEDQELEIIYFQPVTDAPETIQAHAALLEMIRDNTGLTISHDTNLTREQITALRQDNGGLEFSIVQWWLDTDTPQILAVASETSEYNAGWINWEAELEPAGDFTPGEDAAEFSSLISEAVTSMDPEVSNERYAEAEALLLENAVYVPLGYWVQRYLQKPWLQGTRQGPWSGSTPVRIDEEVVVIGDPTGSPEAGEA